MFTEIVFVQDSSQEDGFDSFNTLYNVEGITLHGATEESILEVATYLSNWDMGNPSELTESPSYGSSDDVWKVTVNGTEYILSANRDVAYVALSREVTN